MNRRIVGRGGFFSGLALLLCMWGDVAWAGGISTRFAELRVGNLRPGRVYMASRDILGEPYLIDNKTDGPIDFMMMLRVPTESELQPGYEPIPDLSWISFGNRVFTVPPGKPGGTDFYISVPADLAHLGKKYQVQMGVNSFGGSSFVQMGLMGRALLSVSDQDVPWEKGEKNKHQFSAQLQAVPPAVAGTVPPLGKKISFDQLFSEPLVIKNGSDYPLRCRVSVADVKESFVSPPPGFQPSPKELAVKLRDQRFVIPPHSEKTLQGYIRVSPSLKETKGNYYVTLRVVSEKAPGEIESYFRLFLKGAP